MYNYVSSCVQPHALAGLESIFRLELGLGLGGLDYIDRDNQGFYERRVTDLVVRLNSCTTGCIV